MTRTLAILLFDDVEVLDFCGPYEVFSVANKQSDTAAFDVRIVAEQGPVSSWNGLSVNPNDSLDQCPSPDILLVPGGVGTRKQMNNQRVIDWITSVGARAELVLSVCTGALMLGRSGFLESKAMTTHHAAHDLLQETVPSGVLRPELRFVDTGKVITSAGIAAGIDMSLHVVARLLGDAVARATARHMEYPWERE